MLDPHVSVLVPVHNGEVFVARAIQSALAQTFEALEVIVIDDGSTDRSQGIANALARVDPRVRVIQQARSGVAAARNRGLAAARGAFVAPLDADDLWHPHKIEHQLARFRDESDHFGLVYCFSAVIDDEDRVLAWPRCYAPSPSSFAAMLMCGNIVGNGSAPLVPRTMLLDVGGYDQSLSARHAQGCEDYQAYFRIAERASFDLVPEYLVGYRVTSVGMSRDLDSMRRSSELVVEECAARHPEIPIQVFTWLRARHRCQSSWRWLRTSHPWRFLRDLGRALRMDPIGASVTVFDKGWQLARRLLQRRTVGTQFPTSSATPRPGRPSQLNWLDRRRWRNAVGRE